MIALNAETENMNLNVKLMSDNDSERRNWEAMMMALNAETENTTRMALNTDTEKWWLWMPNEDAMMALNAKTEKWWLCTPNWKCGMVTSNVVNREWMVALNAKRRCGSERQTETKHGSERQTKTDNYERQAKEDDSERNRWEDMVALNVKLRNDQWLWTPKWNNNASERQTKRNINECLSETKTLHAQLNW